MKTKKILILLSIFSFIILDTYAYSEVPTLEKNDVENFKNITNLTQRQKLINNNIKSFNILQNYSNEIQKDEKWNYFVNDYVISQNNKTSLISQWTNFWWIVLINWKIIDIIKSKKYYNIDQKAFVNYRVSPHFYLTRYWNHVIYKIVWIENDENYNKVLNNEFWYYIDGQKVWNFDINNQDWFFNKELNFMKFDNKYNYFLDEKIENNIKKVLENVSPSKYETILNKILNKRKYFINLKNNITSEECKMLELYNYLYTELKIMQLKINYINNTYEK